MSTKRILFAALILLVSCVSSVHTKESRPPNFLIILVDDLGPEQLGCYGSENKTPNIDRFASEGMQFRTAYTAPICSPSRVLLMTGRYGFRTGWLNFTGRPGSPTLKNENYDLGSSEKTFAHLLRDNGYKTGLAGRWLEYGNEHKQIPSAGFDEYQIWAIWGNKLPTGVQHVGAWEREGTVTSRYWHPCLIKDGKYVPTQPKDYAPDLMVEYCKNFLQRHRDRPFILYYPMILVHDPFAPVPDQDNPGEKKEGNLKGFVKYTDYLVGKLLNELDALGLSENTVVIFAGDNGTIGKKGTPTEGGARVPFIVRYPGKIKAGEVSNELTDFSDIFPTLAEYAGLSMPREIIFDGKSLVPTLRDGQTEHRSWIYSYFREAQILRDKRWLFENGKFYDCGNERDGNYKEVTNSTEPEVLAARVRFEGILKNFATTE